MFTFAHTTTDKIIFTEVFLKKSSLFFATFLLLTSFLFANLNSLAFAETTEERLNRLNEEIQEYERELKRLASQARTLSNQIAQHDAQIRLTALKITETEERIFLLGGRISQLETSLNTLTNAFSSRAVQTYKMSRINQPFMLLISAPDLVGAVSSYHYLQKIQEADRGLMVRLEKAQNTYIDERSDQETLQEELEDQKAQLDTQKQSKAKLCRLL